MKLLSTPAKTLIKATPENIKNWRDKERWSHYMSYKLMMCIPLAIYIYIYMYVYIYACNNNHIWS